jgi:lysophospholipase L1-like esterase
VPPRITAPMPSALGATRFVAFGDSLTSGTLSRYDGAFVYDVPSHSYPVRLKLALDTYHAGTTGAPRTYTVVNAGMPGEWARHGADRIASVLAQDRPQGLLLLEGINDIVNEQSISQTVGALDRIVSAARASSVTVLIATMPQTYEVTNPDGETRSNGSELIDEFNRRIRTTFTGRQNVHIVDLHAAFGNDRSLTGGDGLHPTEAGYELMASTFLNVIESVFGIRGSFQ